ncbi:hypothetical protein [Lactococcus sp. LG606]|uniref:hypothetical protein n=1 Tax=Lactococcus sp. LG606 TaxID=2816912 RepID=UPI001F5DB1AE|nr:hypothetical protein [Lactococcus sp. LG606]
MGLDPEIIILDEPTSQFDPQSTEDIFEIISFLKEQGKTIILVEHKADLLAEYCDDILVMSQGKLVLSGDLKKVFSSEKVLEYGGQLPQVTLFFLAAAKSKRISKQDMLPLNIEEAYQKLRKEDQ